MRRDDFKTEQVHPSLRKHNWLFFQESDDFDSAFCSLLEAIATDLDHVKQHTRILVRAIEWEHKNRNPDLLLRGSELESLIQWITQSAEKEPRSTQIQRDYINASRKAESDRQEAEIQRQKQEIRQQRVWLGAVTVALIAATGLGLLAFTQYRTAEAHRKEIELSQIDTLSTSAEAFLSSNQGLEGLMQGLQAARKLQQIEGVSRETKLRVIAALQRALNQMRERNRFEGHQDQVWHLAFSPNGKTIASASRDTTVKLWNLEGKELATLQGHTEPVDWVSFSPNGNLIATGSFDETIRLWSQDGRELQTLKGHTGEVYSVNFSPDGKQLISTGEDSTIRIWNLEGKELKRLDATHPGGALNASFSPDGTQIISCGDDKTIKLWSRSGELRATLSGHREYVKRVLFSPDGKLIASADIDGVIKLWSSDGKELQTIKGHDRAIWGLAFSPNSQELISASNDRTVKRWNLEGKELENLGTFFYTSIGG